MLVTTLTKRMAEDLAGYLKELGIKVHYLHSEVHTLERVEILRGPQGTLFGKNTISGAVHYTTKKPHGNWESTLGLNRGNFNYVNAYTIINAPIVNNKLLARFSGEISTRDGFIRNLYNL